LQAGNPSLFARSNDPATWADYADAVAAVAAGRADGIGYMLAGSDLGAVDLDDCRDPNTGTLAAWAKTEIDIANSYVEITASGTGLRILGIGSGAELQRKFRVPGATNGAAIEVYRRTNRYITVTGAEISGGAGSSTSTPPSTTLWCATRPRSPPKPSRISPAAPTLTI
jgi:primase-polymerase (primpol)-like protein